MKTFHSRLGILLVLALFCVYAQGVWAAPGELRLHALDIGQGDSFLIQTPMGKRLLVDAGPGTRVLERLEEELGFWPRYLDLVVMTHPDLDHIEGFTEVLRRYDVGAILMTGVIHQSSLYREVLRIIEDKNIPILFAEAGKDFLLEEGLLLDILYPNSLLALQTPKNSNDSSIVMKLRYEHTSVLFTGDCEAACEAEQLASDTDLDADVIIGGHHGSRTSFSLPYLLAVTPDMAVMSNGRDNAFGHPHTETREKLEKLSVDYRNTRDSGTVRLVSDGRHWEWRD